MYRYDERTADLYKVINPRFNRPIREHLKWIDIKRFGEEGNRMTITAEGINGRQYRFSTNGILTIKEIIEELIRGLKL